MKQALTSMLNLHLRLIALAGIPLLTEIGGAATLVTAHNGHTVVIEDGSRVIVLGSLLAEIVYASGARTA